ncbi:hypothetical protein VIGAN_09002400 [Vigna angularis var. angularis]|uniref:Uncharacterized protein n=1 Tax=Vigna angularis var. angularis TaxID=157739 RepID=A0A0S3SV94_PHAAN|nr:hypothetical protein VIGAN_09002400 [Vigna angularis var. angularis]
MHAYAISTNICFLFIGWGWRQRAKLFFTMVEKEKENVGFRFLQPTILMSSSYSDSSGGVGISGSCFSPRMCRRCGAGKGVSEELPTVAYLPLS